MLIIISCFSDEVGALVFDIGSYTVRAGYAGEDCPKVSVTLELTGYVKAIHAEFMQNSHSYMIKTLVGIKMTC